MMLVPLLLFLFPTVSADRSKRQVPIATGDEYTRQWPDNTVHFYFARKQFDERVRESVLRAMKKIADHTCIVFSNQHASIMIKMFSKASSNCLSVIGRTFNDQPFVFNDRCYTVGQAVHELIHALGFMHAHQRRDRDQYLNIDMDQYLGTELEMQYKIFEKQKLYVPYDYGSVMQYFGKEDEFTSKNPEFQFTMGSETVSFYDYLMINKYYDCSCETGPNCSNFGYPNPANCSKCNCPYGFGGDDCAQRAESGENLQATTAWKSVNVTLDAGYRKHNGKKDRQLDYVFYYLWITAPENKTIEVRMDYFSGVRCDEGCVRGGFEVKTLEDPRMTSPRQCCTDGLKVYKSMNNPTVVQIFNEQGRADYRLSYRYADKL